MIALTYNGDKEGSKELYEYIKGWYRSKGIEVVDYPVGTKESLEFIMVLGGDGTILNVAKEVAAQEIPILGVNLGRLGFLTSIEKDSLDHYLLQSLNQDNYLVEKRIMLDVTVEENGQSVYEEVALNEVVLSRNQLEGMLGFEVEVSGTKVEEYFADGFIIATPTGSTAYSLSAGGPILTPRMKAMVLTPICPHTLYARPMVVDDAEQVVLRLSDPGREDLVTIDGQKRFLLTGISTISVRISELTARTIRFKDRPFFEVLGEKIGKRK